MRWGRQRRQQQHGQEQSTSAFSLFRVLPLSSWFSKLKTTKSKPEPTPHPAAAAVSRHRCQIPPPSKPRTHPPEFRPRAPPPRFSPERRHLRPSSASDHLSFSPAVLDRLVGRAHEGTSPRRHSCGGDDDAGFFARSRSRGGRPFESARFHMAWSTEPRFPLLSCRSCRADPERQHAFFSPDPDVSSETEREESEGDDSGRERRRRGPEAAPRRRKPVRGRRATGEGPSPPKDSATSLEPSHGVPTGEVSWRSSGRSERSCRRRPSSPEQTAAQDQSASGARRSFSFGGKMRQRSRVKVYSPRAAAAAAAAAAARERNGYTSRKKVAGLTAAEEEERRGRGRKRRSLESFAVVKCSTDPQGDFRESMVEMIRQNGIGRPEEMEGLLACYLALNADEYHDVIVKVFRQLWLDLRTAPLLIPRSEFS